MEYQMEKMNDIRGTNRKKRSIRKTDSGLTKTEPLEGDGNQRCD